MTIGVEQERGAKDERRLYFGWFWRVPTRPKCNLGEPKLVESMKKKMAHTEKPENFKGG